MPWHCIEVKENHGIAGLILLGRIQDYMLTLVASGVDIPDIAMFSLLDAYDGDIWHFPPGTEEVLHPLLTAMDPTPCDAPEPDALAMLFHYSPNGRDPWLQHFGRHPVRSDRHTPRT